MPILSTRAALIVFLTFASQSIGYVFAQESPTDKPVMLSTWFGPGAIALPTGNDWKPEMLTVYDKGTRPVAQYSKGDMTVSFIVFENASGKPNALGCRADAIDPILEHEAKLISKRADGELKNASGQTLATTFYLIDMGGGHHQPNLFGFAGNAKTCAEMHVSTTIETSSPDEQLKAIARDFHADLEYQPNF